jgi:hypothetical protein
MPTENRRTMAIPDISLRVTDPRATVGRQGDAAADSHENRPQRAKM